MSEVERAGYYRCTFSRTPLFTVGTAYEVFRYDDNGVPEIITNYDKTVTLPHADAAMVAYDPWGKP